MRKALWCFLVAVFAFAGPSCEAASLPDQPAFNRSGIASAAGIVRLAESGDPKSQAALGYMYEMGRGVPQNYKLAAMWYGRAAQQGHSGAQYLLAFLFDRGFGVPADHIEAQKWMILAAATASNRRDVETYVRMRNAIATKLTRAEVDEAQWRASVWVPLPER